MYKTNEYYVEKIVSDIDFIQKHMESLTQKQFEANEILVDSMSLRLIQISEAAKNLTEDYKERHKDVPWSDIFALRNRLVHDYGNVDMTIVYNTLTKDIPELKAQLIKLV